MTTHSQTDTETTTDAGTDAPAAIILTDQAAAKAKELSARYEKKVCVLRVFIQGGGCSGFQYGFTLEDEVNDDDMIIENDGVKLAVDPLSFQYLMGSKVDYLEDLQGARFVIHNPNASTTCGCGASFAI